ncbi:MAG: DUF6473 family protein [Rhodobacterales bacterium]|nr:DUF6473 family protein [Puniceibacterium antarcticum]
MSFALQGQSGLDYDPCRYGRSRLLFRGPQRSPEGPYLAFLGGSETYGRFIPAPFPDLLEQQIGLPCLNFGSINAGVDLYLHDAGILDLIGAARLNVIQVMGAQNMSNRFYSVHPRRNDRFLQASPLLMQLFEEVDFTEIHFTRHLLRHLQQVSEERFQKVVAELRSSWVLRMRHLLSQTQGQSILVWLAPEPPGAPSCDLNRDPLFVDFDMLDALRPQLFDIVEVTPSPEAQEWGTAGMAFNEFETCVAQGLMNPRAHEEVAQCLAGAIRPLLAARSGH